MGNITKQLGNITWPQKEWIWVRWTEMNKPRVLYSEASHKEKNKYRILSHIYGI